MRLYIAPPVIQKVICLMYTNFLQSIYVSRDEINLVNFNKLVSSKIWSHIFSDIFLIFAINGTFDNPVTCRSIYVPYLILQLKDRQPLEYLSEMRQVSMLFINLMTDETTKMEGCLLLQQCFEVIFKHLKKMGGKPFVQNNVLEPQVESFWMQND